MAVDLEAIEDAAKSKTAKAVEYIRTVHVDPPRISLMNGLIAFLIWMLITAGVTYYFVRENSKWWRAEIASKSRSVNDAIKKANGDLPDNEILKTLGDSDAKLRAAEAALRQKPAPATDRCPAVPRDCLR